MSWCGADCRGCNAAGRTVVLLISIFYVLTQGGPLCLESRARDCGSLLLLLFLLLSPDRAGKHCVQGQVTCHCGTLTVKRPAALCQQRVQLPCGTKEAGCTTAAKRPATPWQQRDLLHCGSEEPAALWQKECWLHIGFKRDCCSGTAERHLIVWQNDVHSVFQEGPVKVVENPRHSLHNKGHFATMYSCLLLLCCLFATLLQPVIGLCRCT